jgi:3-phenylpropionate/trans-cinnamate dioxygenase ferredoxin reductase subunit
MPDYKYLIVGGGMSADAAASGIREVDSTGSIGIVSAETEKPYNRPPLTKALWKGEPLESIWRGTEKKGVEFHLGRQVKSLDAQQKRAVDDQQIAYKFDKLLLATGGTPRRLPFGDDGVIYYRTLGDYRRLRALTEQHKRFAVIGNGFIGAEIAAALATNAKEVAMIFPADGICHRVFPRELSQFVTNYYREKGVEILAHESATGLEERQGQYCLKLASGREVLVSGITAGIGIQPNVELAEAAGLKVENGVVVNQFLQTTQSDIYAAGDMARFFNPALGKEIRVEHEDNANTMGRIAGRNMAGKSEPYYHLPSFYSDLFDFGYEAVGELDARLETFADWKRPFREGVIYYLRDGRVRGVLLWNVWGKVDAARNLIAEVSPLQTSDLKGRITN